MTARFILSFDCEGKWGVADQLTPAHRRALTDANLREAYRSILAVLDEYSVPATFAFSGAFSQSAKDFGRLSPEITALAKRAPDYLGPALKDIAATRGDGWHGENLVAAVAGARAQHEIALHGVTHVPWTAMDSSFVEAEMCLFEALEGPVRLSRTFVYPRNQVAHQDVLAAYGFAGFRAARPERSRLASLIAELNLFEMPEQPQPSGPIVAIPAGFFLNWRSGPRRVIPKAVTNLRAHRLLERAAADHGIVHYWLHPENVATAASTLDVLRSLVKHVAQAREAGRCEVLTQRAYCDA